MPLSAGGTRKANAVSDPAPSESPIAALLQEHDELVQLVIHEDYVAWQINVLLLAANSALLGALHALGLLDPQQPVTAAALIVLLAGVLINVTGVFVMQRRRVYRLARMHRAYRVEAELSRAGSPIRTFSSVDRVIASGRMPAAPESSPAPPAPETARPLKFYERVWVLDFRLAFYAVGLIYLALVIWTAVGRPTGT